MTARTKWRLVAGGAAAAIAYLASSAGMFWAMRQTPDRFGRIMSYVPMPAMAVLPFRPLWKIARAGDLRIDDLAPDFELPAYDKSGRVRLSDYRGKSPVVLVFGSYT